MVREEGTLNSRGLGIQGISTDVPPQRLLALKPSFPIPSRLLIRETPHSTCGLK
jgi:hypothetical protein